MRPATPILLAAVLGASAACSRDLDLPARNTLAFADAFPTAAPRESLLLSVTGGAPPYAFSFVGGAAGSGPDAALDSATGAYVAGSLGPALDAVEVRDASGAVRGARVTVGPPLQVVPSSAFVAPGGTVGFAASGGKPPYALEILAGAGSVSGTSYHAPPSGGCAGSVSAPTSVQLRLRDATLATPVDLTVSVGRGLDLFPALGDGAVAPHEQLAFVASGGQPPYEFSTAPGPVPSGGPGIDPGRGTYVAGPVGDVVDRVVVTDAMGEQRCFDVTVGPPLSLGLSTSDVRPGKAMRLVAAGGRPPYAYAFVPKGNRSRGTLDPVTGAYVPGLNALATDLVQVSDATNGPPLGPLAVPVGPLQVASGPSSAGCAAGDADRNGLADAFAFEFNALKLVRSSAGALPETATYALPGLFTFNAVADLDADGDADVAWAEDSVGVHTLLGRPDGGLTEGPFFAAFASHVAVAQGGRRVFVDVFDTFPTCAAGGSGILALDLDPTATSLSPSCVATFPQQVLWLAAGDFDGDGTEDVAYTAFGVTDRISFRMGGGPTPYATAREVLLAPAPWRFDFLPSTISQQMVAVRPDGQAASDLVAIAIDAPRTAAFRTGLAVFRGAPAGPTLQQVGLVQPGADGAAFNLLGVSALGLGPGGRPRIAAWNGTDGAALLLDYPFTTNPPAPSPDPLAPRGFRVGCMAGGDFDLDGIEDLLVLPRDTGPLAELLLGEGDGTFGRRPRFASRTGAQPAGDVDLDGHPDFAGASPSGGLEVLLYTDGQLAVGPETPLAGQLLGSPALADFDGDGVADAMARVGPTGFSFFKGLLGSDPGRFAPAAAVSTVDALGAAYPVTTVFFLPANLGGAGPGPDLLAVIRVGSQLHVSAIRFQDAAHAEVGLATPLAGVTTNWVAADLDGDGVDDVVTTPSDRTVRVALVKPSDPRGATWPFRPWTTAAAAAADTPRLAGAIPVPGAIPPRARAFLVSPAGLVSVDAAGGAPVATTTALPANLYSEATALAIGDATGDGLPDLVVARTPPLPWLVFPGTADGLVSGTPRADLSFSPGLGATFSAVPGASGAADLVLETSGGLLVLRNDGAGRFR